MRASPHKPTLSWIESVGRGDRDEGFCQSCGYTQSGCEPDMRGGICESCGAKEVYGFEEYLLEGEYTDDGGED